MQVVQHGAPFDVAVRRRAISAGWLVHLLEPEPVVALNHGGREHWEMRQRTEGRPADAARGAGWGNQERIDATCCVIQGKCLGLQARVQMTREGTNGRLGRLDYAADRQGRRGVATRRHARSALQDRRRGWHIPARFAR